MPIPVFMPPLAFRVGLAPGLTIRTGGSRLGGGTVFTRRRHCRRLPLAQPSCIRPGFIQAGFHTTGQGLGEHQCVGGLEFAAQQIGGAGRLESQRPPVPAARADLGEFHLAPRLLARPRGGRRSAGWPMRTD